jgi:hypothetical protein
MKVQSEAALWRQIALRNQGKPMTMLSRPERIQYVQDALWIFDQNLDLMWQLWKRVRTPSDPEDLAIFLASRHWNTQMSKKERREVISDLAKDAVQIRVLKSRVALPQKRGKNRKRQANSRRYPLEKIEKRLAPGSGRHAALSQKWKPDWQNRTTGRFPL